MDLCWRHDGNHKWTRSTNRSRWLNECRETWNKYPCRRVRARLFKIIEPLASGIQHHQTNWILWKEIESHSTLNRYELYGQQTFTHTHTHASTQSFRKKNNEKYMRRKWNQKQEISWIRECSFQTHTHMSCLTSPDRLKFEHECVDDVRRASSCSDQLNLSTTRVVCLLTQIVVVVAVDNQ